MPDEGTLGPGEDWVKPSRAAPPGGCGWGISGWWRKWRVSRQTPPVIFVQGVPPGPDYVAGAARWLRASSRQAPKTVRFIPITAAAGRSRSTSAGARHPSELNCPTG